MRALRVQFGWAFPSGELPERKIERETKQKRAIHDVFGRESLPTSPVEVCEAAKWDSRGLGARHGLPDDRCTRRRRMVDLASRSGRGRVAGFSEHVGSFDPLLSNQRCKSVWP